MNETQTQCVQPNRLAAYLDGNLTGHEERKIEGHLDDCENCRQQIDKLAATPDSWNAVRSFLPDDDRDRVSVTSVDGAAAGITPQISQVLDILQPTDDPTMLGRLGGYEVSGVVGAGGMGVVLKAFDRPLDRTVAIKVLAPHLATSGAARQRFSREARAAAAVLHPNVIAIHGVSTDGVLPFLVMPYVGGASLQKRIDENGPLPTADILRIGVQISSGLAAAHEQGLVHRDIKPANILLDDGVDRLIITDFGLARAVDDASVTRTGMIAGTPQYMSPEQARGDSVDSRSDLFSLGSVMYAMCTGRVPFRADNPYGVLKRISDNSPRPIGEINPEIPEWLCEVVNMLHAKSPEDRFRSAQKTTEVLTQCLAHVTQPETNRLPPQLHAGQRRGTGLDWYVPLMFFAGICVLFALLPLINRSDDRFEENSGGTGTAASTEESPAIRQSAEIDANIAVVAAGDTQPNPDSEDGTESASFAPSKTIRTSPNTIDGQTTDRDGRRYEASVGGLPTTVTQQAIRANQRQSPESNDLLDPLDPAWQLDQSVSAWDDNLDAVFRHIEHSLNRMESETN